MAFVQQATVVDLPRVQLECSEATVSPTNIQDGSLWHEAEAKTQVDVQASQLKSLKEMYFTQQNRRLQLGKIKPDKGILNLKGVIRQSRLKVQRLKALLIKEQQQNGEWNLKWRMLRDGVFRLKHELTLFLGNLGRSDVYGKDDTDSADKQQLESVVNQMGKMFTEMEEMLKESRVKLTETNNLVGFSQLNNSMTSSSSSCPVTSVTGSVVASRKSDSKNDPNHGPPLEQSTTRHLCEEIDNRGEQLLCHKQTVCSVQGSKNVVQTTIIAAPTPETCFCVLSYPVSYPRHPHGTDEKLISNVNGSQVLDDQLPTRDARKQMGMSICESGPANVEDIAPKILTQIKVKQSSHLVDREPLIEVESTETMSQLEPQLLLQKDKHRKGEAEAKCNRNKRFRFLNPLQPHSVNRDKSAAQLRNKSKQSRETLNKSKFGGESKSQCKVCNGGFRFVNDLHRHFVSDHNIDPIKLCKYLFGCWDCGKLFLAGSILIKHRRKAHCSRKSKVPKVVTPLESPVFSAVNVCVPPQGLSDTLEKLSYPMNILPPDLRDNSSSFVSLDQIKTEPMEDDTEVFLDATHPQIKHGMDRTKVGRRRYACLCGVTSTTDSNLRRHITYHTCKPHFKCSQCDKRYKFTCYLRTHMNKAHNMDYTLKGCPKCGELFATLSELYCHQSLLKHRRIKKKIDKVDLTNNHTPSSPLPAGAVPRMSADFYLLHKQPLKVKHGVDNSRQHFGHFCLCGAKASTSRNLSLHIRRFTSERKSRVMGRMDSNSAYCRSSKPMWDMKNQLAPRNSVSNFTFTGAMAEKVCDQSMHPSPVATTWENNDEDLNVEASSTEEPNLEATVHGTAASEASFVYVVRRFVAYLT